MRRRIIHMVIAVVTVLGVLGASVGADAVTRAEMASIAQVEIAHGLSGPQGTVDPDHVEAEVHGTSAILQLLLGTIEHISVRVPDVVVGEATAELHAEMYDVPTNQVQPVGRMYAYLQFDEAAVEALAQQFISTPVTSVDLEPPYVQVSTTVRTVAGEELQVSIDIDPNVRNGEIVLVPASFRLEGVHLDPEQFQRATGIDPSSFLDTGGFCVESSIPESMTVDDFRVSNGVVVIVLGAEQLTVFELGGPHGYCSQ